MTKHFCIGMVSVVGQYVTDGKMRAKLKEKAIVCVYLRKLENPKLRELAVYIKV